MVCVCVRRVRACVCPACACLCVCARAACAWLSDAPSPSSSKAGLLIRWMSHSSQNCAERPLPSLKPLPEPPASVVTSPLNAMTRTCTQHAVKNLPVSHNSTYSCAYASERPRRRDNRVDAGVSLTTKPQQRHFNWKLRLKVPKI